MKIFLLKIVALLSLVGSLVLCCLGPFILMFIGANAFIISIMNGYQWLGLVLYTVAYGIMLGIGYHIYYDPSNQCEIGKPCRHPIWVRVEKISFWCVFTFIVFSKGVL